MVAPDIKKFLIKNSSTFQNSSKYFQNFNCVKKKYDTKSAFYLWFLIMKLLARFKNKNFCLKLKQKNANFYWGLFVTRLQSTRAGHASIFFYASICILPLCIAAFNVNSSLVFIFLPSQPLYKSFSPCSRGLWIEQSK